MLKLQKNGWSPCDKGSCMAQWHSYPHHQVHTLDSARSKIMGASPLVLWPRMLASSTGIQCEDVPSWAAWSLHLPSSSSCWEIGVGITGKIPNVKSLKNIWWCRTCCHKTICWISNDCTIWRCCRHSNDHLLRKENTWNKWSQWYKITTDALSWYVHVLAYLHATGDAMCQFANWKHHQSTHEIKMYNHVWWLAYTHSVCVCVCACASYMCETSVHFPNASQLLPNTKSVSTSENT